MDYNTLTHTVMSFQSKIIAICIPFLYSAVRVPVKWAHPKSHDKMLHVGIMTVIGVAKGYLESESMFAEGSKSFVKFSVRGICAESMKPYTHKNMAMGKDMVKFTCAAGSTFVASIYSNGFTDAVASIHKSLFSGGTSIVGGKVRKVVKNLALLKGDGDELVDGLEGLIWHEIELLPNNIAHSAVLVAGKEVSNYCLGAGGKASALAVNEGSLLDEAKYMTGDDFTVDEGRWYSPYASMDTCFVDMQPAASYSVLLYEICHNRTPCELDWEYISGIT